MISSGYSGFLHQKTDFIIIISLPWCDPAVAEALNPNKPNKSHSSFLLLLLLLLLSLPPSPAHVSDVTKRAIIDVYSIVSWRNYDILTSIIAQLLTSRPFPDLCYAWSTSPCLCHAAVVANSHRNPRLLHSRFGPNNPDLVSKQLCPFDRVLTGCTPENWSLGVICVLNLIHCVSPMITSM